MLNQMADTRESKRVRQACLNCRRKKVRCSGDRPICAFCSRLGQKCTWDDSQSTGGSFWQRNSGGTQAESDLAARVALLESQLDVFNKHDLSSLLQQNTTTPKVKSVPKDDDAFQYFLETPEPSLSSHPLDRAQIDDNDYKGQNLPSPELVQSLVDTYFLYCHNQPYCYFHEPTFRSRLEAGSLPEHLILSVLATAVRFSDHEAFVGIQTELIASYSQAAWAQIVKYSFSFEDVLDVQMVQSMAHLAALDFTSGHQRLGWVKIGLSVRFAQGLRLYQEPSHHLRPSEQEELRRTFWSVYLSDRLVSTGPYRPPTFVDEDCTVQLPCHEELYKEDLPCGNAPTLSDLTERPDHPYSYSLDNFALSVLMASSLGQINRYSMKKETSRSIPPWDYRSQFSKIYSSLLYFESYSIGTPTSVADTIQHHFTKDGLVDQHRAGHFVFSQALYHLNQCLLNHPFLLHQRCVACKASIPPSFVNEILRRGRQHANQLTEVLHQARIAGCLAESAWYGYCALAAGVINKLFQYHDDPNVAAESKTRLQMSLDFLEREPVRWLSFARMATALRSFNPEIPTAKALVTPALLAQKSPIHGDDSFWCMIDYGWLSDAAKDHTTPHGTNSDSFELENLDIADEVVDPSVLSHKDPFSMSSSGNEMKNILGDDMGSLFSELLGYEQSASSDF